MNGCVLLVTMEVIAYINETLAEHQPNTGLAPCDFFWHSKHLMSYNDRNSVLTLNSNKQPFPTFAKTYEEWDAAKKKKTYM